VFIEAMDVYGDYFPGFAAVVSAAGVTPFKPIRALTAANYTASYTSEALGQIDLVGHGKRHERAAIRQDALNLDTPIGGRCGVGRNAEMPCRGERMRLL
jgi:hypothetical protein